MRRDRKGLSFPHRVALFLALTGVVWLVVPSALAGLLSPGLIGSRAVAETVAGGLLIAVGALLLYGLVHREWLRWGRSAPGRDEGEQPGEAATMADSSGALEVANETTAQLQRELHRQGQFLRALFESVTDIIGVLDAEGRLRFITPSASRILGYGSDELEARDVISLVHPDDRQSARDTIRLILAGGVQDPPVTAYRVRHKNGSWHHLEVVGSQLAGTEEPQLILTGRDVTERLAAEAALADSEAQLRHAQKMEAVGLLAGGIAHDFNNLVTSILGYVHVLSESLRDQPELIGDLREIRTAAERANNLTRQLLTFSRREVRRPEQVDVGDLIRDTDKLLRRVIGEDVRLHTFVGTNAGPVLIDRGQLEQVILNLAVNARDAMPRGGELRITVDRIPHSDDASELKAPFVRIDVEDTGIGMSEETAGHAFEPFFTTKEAGVGTGLGLSIVYGIITQANGRVAVSSEPEQGARVRIDLPIVPAGGFDAESTTEPHQSLASLGGMATVLVVEDEDGVRRLCNRLLSRLGYTVLEARNGREALDVCRNGAHIDLLLTDVVMPELDGGRLIEAVHESRPEVKVIVMSGYTDDKVVRHGIERGTFHFLAKPFTPITLARAVSKVLREG